LIGPVKVGKGRALPAIESLPERNQSRNLLNNLPKPLDAKANTARVNGETEERKAGSAETIFRNPLDTKANTARVNGETEERESA
jgi:hypothetical protein